MKKILLLFLILSSIITKAQDTLCYEKSLIAHNKAEIYIGEYVKDYNCIILYIQEDKILLNDLLLFIEEATVNREHDFIDFQLIAINEDSTEKRYNMTLTLDYAILAEEDSYPVIILSNID